MSGLISRKPGPPPDKPGPKSFYVDGVRYANAAAKFWPSLIDEVAEDFPDCTGVELATPATGKLQRGLLFPELAMQNGIDALQGANIRKVMEETLAELELLGPPAAVQVRLFSRERELLATELPLDCVDSETFPCLVVWPLEWAGIPTELWNDDSVKGSFAAEDRRRGIIYEVSFALTRTHLSEGLYRRSFFIEHSVSMFA